MLTWTRGAPDEHRLGGEEALCFQRTVGSFLPDGMGDLSLVVGRERGLKTKSGC